MPSIFISYARETQEFVLRLSESLAAMGADVWVDFEDIPVGMNWSSAIQQGLDTADLMLVVISPDSMASVNVEQEWQYYIDEKKPIIPVLLQPAKVHFQLRRLQYVDFHTLEYNRALRKLHSALGSKGVKLNAPPRTTDKRTPLPITPPPAAASSTAAPAPTYQAAVPVQRSSRPIIFGVIGLLALALAAVAFVLPALNNSSGGTSTPLAAAATSSPLAQPTDTDTPTLDARQAAVATRDTRLTEAAASRTPTPTTDFQATIAMQLTELVYEDQTATATLWTATPTETNTATPVPSATFTATFTPSPTLTQPPTLTPSPTFTPTPLPLGFAGNPVTRNADWTPQVDSFDGVDMVLVPVGCFDMGDGGSGGRQCFDQPFWIDRFEVTNGQFSALNGQTAFNRASRSSEAQRPRERIWWTEALAFCQSRGGSLPTEAEWEYAARGPDGLLYPWGGTFESNRVVYNENAGGQTADVGSRPGGVSWVGAQDMSGNLWEWALSTNASYPYNASDGRNNLNADTRNRIARGGAFDYYIDNLSMTLRRWYAPETANYNLGFRCMRPYTG